MTAIEKQMLVKFLGDHKEILGNAGCNDWSMPYGPALWDWIQKVFEYGIVNNLWDDGCPPTHNGNKIYWFDFMIVSYLSHILKREIAVHYVTNDYERWMTS